MSFNNNMLLERIFFVKNANSQREFGVFLGIDEKIISSWRNSKSIPTFEHLEIIRKKCELDWEYLFTGRSYNPVVIVNAHFPVLINLKEIQNEKQYNIAKSILVKLASYGTFNINVYAGLIKAAWIYYNASKTNGITLDFELLGEPEDNFEECANVASDFECEEYESQREEWKNTVELIRNSMLGLKYADDSEASYLKYVEIQNRNAYLADIRQGLHDKQKIIQNLEYNVIMLEQKLEAARATSEYSEEDIVDFKENIKFIERIEELKQDKNNMQEQIDLLKEKNRSLESQLSKQGRVSG